MDYFSCSFCDNMLHTNCTDDFKTCNECGEDEICLKCLVKVGPYYVCQKCYDDDDSLEYAQFIIDRYIKDFPLKSIADLAAPHDDFSDMTLNYTTFVLKYAHDKTYKYDPATFKTTEEENELDAKFSAQYRRANWKFDNEEFISFLCTKANFDVEKMKIEFTNQEKEI